MSNCWLELDLISLINIVILKTTRIYFVIAVLNLSSFRLSLLFSVQLAHLYEWNLNDSSLLKQSKSDPVPVFWEDDLKSTILVKKIQQSTSKYMLVENLSKDHLCFNTFSNIYAFLIFRKINFS